MKLISLNTWGGKMFDPLMDFIRSHRQSTDIFCFQEIYNTKSNIKQHGDIRANLLDELIKILLNFHVFYTIEFSGYDSNSDPVDFDLTIGKAIFVKNNIQIINQGELLIYEDKSGKILKKDFSNIAITLQCINFQINGKLFTVCNFHGTPAPGTKLDTPLRLKQSTEILNFLQDRPNAKIITGDFNLLPKTKSIKMFEKDFRNLIKEFKIERTRSNLSPYFGEPDFQKFADYTFVSKDIKVLSFEVPDLEISDHLPMILEFT